MTGGNRLFILNYYIGLLAGMWIKAGINLGDLVMATCTFVVLLAIDWALPNQDGRRKT